MAVLNLVLFLLFSGLYISRGIQLELLDPLHQAEDRLERKIEDGELQLDCLPREGLGEELRFLRTLEQRGPDLVVVSFQCDSPHMDFFRGLVTFVGESERSLLARIVEESGTAFSTPLNDPSTTTLQRRAQAPFGGEALLAAALEELLIRLIRRQSTPAIQIFPCRTEDDNMNRVLRYMEQRVEQNLTLEQICRDNLIGRSQLQKLFHSHTGGGVMEYFSWLKIQTARRMIREGRLNFTQIATRLSFQSVHYFSRRFRQITGMSPSEYAQSVRMLSDLPGVSTDDYTKHV